MDDSKQKIALFIDADNAPANKFEDVLSEVAKYGVVTIRKAYGNWKKSSIKPWRRAIPSWCEMRERKNRHSITGSFMVYLMRIVCI
ncbi:Uncharacterised protein [Halioglobus japonicus]|nr:Uncharacterised protein [Halioglobus japonicus]